MATCPVAPQSVVSTTGAVKSKVRPLEPGEAFCRTIAVSNERVLAIPIFVRRLRAQGCALTRSHDGARAGRLARARGTGADSAKPAPATEQAVAAIMHMITAGELGPGDRLPTGRGPAPRLGLSAGTIRRALQGLTML